MNPDPGPLPLIIAGPILRRVTPDRVVLWLAVSEEATFRACLYRRGENAPFFSQTIEGAAARRVRIGERAFVQLIDLRPAEPLPTGEMLEYDLIAATPSGEASLKDLIPDLTYDDERRPSFAIHVRLDRFLHGSCRKPHYESGDALLRVDEAIGESLNDANSRPALLTLSGDQVYCDDVAGPMLSAIHQAAARVGLFLEALDGAKVPDSESLLGHQCCYYRREELLPATKANKALRDRFFGGVRKPIFTAETAQNHLIALRELCGMYLLVWSPALWGDIRLDPDDVAAKHREAYQTELPHVQGFAEGLSRVRRALAHVPVYMIFDDHDVTDDWNLTRGWEDAAYGHPFSRRILGNALIAYWLFQGWGNDPDRFDDDFVGAVRGGLDGPGGEPRDALVGALFAFHGWHYTLPTSPRMVVMDTRTRRWWSETSLSKPSGLMDWEALSELQGELVDQPAVLMVSPAPIFGVKLIETVQRVFAYFGHALLVDAENWMAHPGSANVILNIFRHTKTPQNFVILSGDVHYSFVYDVKIRFAKTSPDIWQITCSGFKNEFPHGLLRWFDRLNRWFYGSDSPLNLLTKRRRMRVRARRPEGLKPRRLANMSALGQVVLDENGVPTEIAILPADGGKIVFPPPDARFRR